MTPQEAKKMLKAKLECLKNETSGINHDCNMRLCDGCSLNYEQGNMGEQKEALQMAIKALESQRWIPVSERLPEDFGTYLITLENGDVCNCEFNPDYIDEEHNKGAFTYYQDYFDNYTLGLIDSEEIAVDAIAWMPFEPYTESEE